MRRSSAAVAIVALASSLVFAARTDVVVLKNGDHLTCEIKELERGKLRVKTDDLGTVQIEWDNVRELTSNTSFTLDMEDGTEYLGPLAVSPEEGKVRVVTEGGPVDLDPLAIVRMAAIKATFWSRVDGSLSLGANYTRSSDVGQFNLSADARYRTPAYLTSFEASAVITQQPEVGSTQRADLTTSYLRFLRNRWLAGGELALQRNEDLGIDLRVLAGGGIGRNLFQTNRTAFALLGGLAVNRETVTGSAPGGTSLEILLNSKYEIFQYDDPETDLSIGLTVLPGVTEWGRVRGELDARLRREIIKDFFFDISVFDSYDSDPPTAEAETNDWGVVTSVGWTF